MKRSLDRIQLKGERCEQPQGDDWQEDSQAFDSFRQSGLPYLYTEDCFFPLAFAIAGATSSTFRAMA